MHSTTVGFAMCGSFCNFEQSFQAMETLKLLGYSLLPIFSEAAAVTDTRFGPAAQHLARAEAIAGRAPVLTIAAAEPIGPKALCDIMVVCPCTGTTLAKLAAGISEGAVPMAVKSHLRGGRPVLLAFASNDALAASAKNLGELLCRRNYFFLPMRQDDPVGKPTSLVAEFSLLPQAVEAALAGRQLRPLFL
ncbi:MAG: dipicolinate synthase subunit B [Oscillospiraceae bacterium]|nr:dipicolinate synthase subunit B [Oscillospiraceae bacterium]